MLHPHRLLVPSEPLKPEERNIDLRGDENGPPMGERSKSFSYWHKDKLGRIRYHVPRYIFLFYFPQDTPVARGPSRVIPGSQYQDHATEEDYRFAYVPDQVQAGNCILAAIDIDHAGMSNLTDQTRHMVKFNFLRTHNPQEPSWDGGDGDWQEPAETLGRYVHPQTWSYVWDWMRGRRKVGFEPVRDIDRHISQLNGADQQQRLAAIYSLGAMGEPALEPLLSSLERVEGQNHIEPPYYVRKTDGIFEVRGDPLERRWTKDGYICQDEAFALGCLGEIAVDPLMLLLDREDPWIAINAAFALGEIGSSAARAVPRLASMLNSPDHRVVQAVLDSIACIGSNTVAALPAIGKLLHSYRDGCGQDLKIDHPVGDKIHISAVYALLLSDLDIEEIEDLLIELLEALARNAIVPAMALEILIQRGSPKGIRCALAYLQAHRWDDSRWPEEIGRE